MLKDTHCLWAILFLTLLKTAPLRAEGVDSSGGGDAIVCFAEGVIAKSFVSQDNTLTSEGRKRIEKDPSVKVYALDFYRVKDSPHLVKNVSGKYEDIFKHILARFKGLPAFQEELNKYRNRLPLIGEYGVPATHGLLDLSDSQRIQNLPDYCVEIQAAVRTGDVIDYDSLLWKLMDEMNRAVLQSHEVIYYFAKESLRHQTSKETMVLLGALLTAPEIWQDNWGEAARDKKNYFTRSTWLKAQVQSQKFGSYGSIEENYGHKMFLLKIALARSLNVLAQVNRQDNEEFRKVSADYATEQLHGIVDRLLPSSEQGMCQQIQHYARQIRLWTNGYKYPDTHREVEEKLRDLQQKLESFVIEGFADPYQE